MPLNDFDGWQKIEPLGEGGQGTVYKARSPERSSTIRDSIAQIAAQLQQFNTIAPKPISQMEDLMKRIADVGGPDDVKHLGALKVFKMPTEIAAQNKARGRLVQEVDALKAMAALDHPAVLKLLYS